MSDPQALARLDDGVVIWNAWRRAMKRAVVDLATADLSGRDLRGIDFSRTDLEGANLAGARLDEADLSEVDGRGMILDRASLTGAQLCGADLSASSLHRASLRRADLSAARLVGANLNEADMEDATLRDARFEAEPEDQRTITIDGESRLEFETALGAEPTGGGVTPAILALLRTAEWRGARNGASGDPTTGMMLSPLKSTRRAEAAQGLRALEETLLTRLPGRPFARLRDPEPLRRLIGSWNALPEGVARMGSLLMVKTSERGGARSMVERLEPREWARLFPRGRLEGQADEVARRLATLRAPRTATEGR